MCKLYLLFFSSFLMISCQESVVFSDHKSLSENIQWNKSDARSFSVPINDNSTPLQLDLLFRYASGYMYDRVLIRMTETAPDGNVTIRDLDIPVRDEQGEFIGDKGFDIIDLTYTIDPARSYPVHGTYVYSFQHTMPEIDSLHFAMELGLRLSKPSAD